MSIIAGPIDEQTTSLTSLTSGTGGMPHTNVVRVPYRARSVCNDKNRTARDVRRHAAHGRLGDTGDGEPRGTDTEDDVSGQEDGRGERTRGHTKRPEVRQQQRREAREDNGVRRNEGRVDDP